MHHTWRRGLRLALGAVLLFAARGASAQSVADAGEAGVGAQLVTSTRATMPTGNPSIPDTGTGGTAAGVIGTVVGFPSRFVGVGAEFSLPLFVTDDQHAAKFIARHRHRDVLISGLVHVRSAPDRRVQIASVGGISLVHEETRTAIAFPDPLTHEFEPLGPENSTTRWTTAATFGVDLRIVLTAHAMLVPSLRIDAIRRDERNEEFVGLGVWIYRPGVTLRATF